VIEFGFDVNADELRSGLGKGFGEMPGLVQHEVNIEEESRNFATKFRDHLRAEGQIRHKVAVHDIEVEPRRAGGGDLCGAFSQPDVLTCEKRGG